MVGHVKSIVQESWQSFCPFPLVISCPLIKVTGSCILSTFLTRLNSTFGPMKFQSLNCAPLVSTFLPHLWPHKCCFNSQGLFLLCTFCQGCWPNLYPMSCVVSFSVFSMFSMFSVLLRVRVLLSFLILMRSLTGSYVPGPLLATPWH